MTDSTGTGRGILHIALGTGILSNYSAGITSHFVPYKSNTGKSSAVDPE